MPANKIRRNGSFAPLSAHAYKDDALASAGEAAELLYYRGLSFCADVLSDGYISETQLVRFVGVGMKDSVKRAARLIEAGLWLREEGGYRVVAWLKWNRSRDEIFGLNSKDAERKRQPPAGEDETYESESGRNPDGVQAESEQDGARSPDGLHSRARTPSLPPSPSHLHTTAATASRTAKSDAEFAAFWRVYPRRVGKESARKAFAKAARNTDPTEIIAGAVSFAAQREGEDVQYTAYPATWLNAGRWQDETTATTTEDFQLPPAPREVIDDPDPSVYVRWARQQRDTWLTSRRAT